jgi:hypothetical protein
MSLRFIALITTALLTSAGATWAGVSTWAVGEGGLPWEPQSEVSAAIDFEIPKAIQPCGFSADENIIQEVKPWEDLRSSPPGDLRAEGMPQVWNNTAESFSNAAIVDGDSTTSTGETFKKFGVTQIGRIFYFDLGASYWANRIVFYPDRDEEGNFVEDFVRGFEVSINDGQHFSKEGRPEYEVLRRLEVTMEPVVDIGFSLQLVRFIKLRILASNPFEIAELEVYGQGFVPRASYLSKFIEFQNPVNFGNLTLRVEKWGEEMGKEAEVSAVLQVRNGTDDTPLVYYSIDVDTREEKEISEDDWYKLFPEEAPGVVIIRRGPIRYDSEHWSIWSEPLRIDATGTSLLPLDFLPGPRRYFQFRILFTGSSTEIIRVNSLSVQHSPALADSCVGEVALLGQPDPPRGVTTTPTGVEATFTYDVRAEFDSQLNGFDGIRIETPGRPDSIRLEMGNPLIEVMPDSMEVEDTGLELYFRSDRVTPGNNRPIRVSFKTTPPIIPGDASQEVNTSSLQVFGSLEEPLSYLEMSPNPITPHGDGRNDETEIAYGIVYLLEKVTVSVGIYDLSGSKVKTVFSERLGSGRYTEAWDGRNDQGNLVPPGIYLCKVSVDTRAKTFSRLKTVAVVY